MPASAVRSVSPLTSSRSGWRHAERVGRDLDEHGRGALADVDGAAEQDDAALARDAHLDRRRVGDRGVADAVPHGPDPDARGAVRTPGVALCAAASARSRRQCGRSASRQAARPALAASSWPLAVVSPARIALASRSSSGSWPSWSASSSISASWAIAAWGTPKPRNAPAGGLFVYTARRRREDRVPGVRAHRVDGHAVRDGRAPRGVGAGVEVAVEAERGEPAGRVGAGRGA